MLDPFRKILDRIEPLPSIEEPDKITDLPSAVKKHVKPNMLVHLCTSHNRPGAVSLEFVRAFRNQRPNLTLSCLGFTGNGVIPVHTGVATRLITTFCGDSYPTPGPNPVIDRAWKEGTLEVENWTILTFPLRLLAGAMGVPYLLTRSVVGSSMAHENQDSFQVTESENGEKLGMVKALNPDIAFIHVPCADQSGNCLLTPPFGEEALGAWAARHGVIVTADRIVSTDYIREHSHLCKVPSYMVRAVCKVPFGAHPGGVSSQGLPDFEAYADDYDFVLDVRKACKTPESTEEWVKEWVDERPAWEDYLEKLGHERLWALKGKARPDSWKTELLSLSSGIPDEEECSPVEMMVIAAGRVLARRIREQKLFTILAGVGASNLAAWLAYYHLREEGVNCELMAELGFYGYVPRPADPFIFNYRNMPTSKMLTGIPAIMGVFMGGFQNQCIGSIGAGQVDKHANINTTKIPGVAYLTGSGGGNDICSAANDVVVTALSGKNRMVEELSYVTSPGGRVSTLVTDYGVFEKEPGESELVLTGYFEKPDMEEQEIVEKIKERCGWELATGPLEAYP
ncbi:MAG: CoA-transferase, partial [bacterium]